MWLDDGIKSGLISPKNCPKGSHTLLHNSDNIRNSPQSHQNIWVTFVRQFFCQELVKIAQSGHTAWLAEFMIDRIPEFD